MAIAVVSNVTGFSTDSNGITTSAIDTTGATLLVVGLAESNASADAITDSKSNTWTQLTSKSAFGSQRATLSYAANPSVGTGHTFSVAGTSIFPTIMAVALSGTATVSPFDVAGAGGGTSGTSVAPGTLTPGANNEIVVAFLEYDVSDTPTVSGGFTILSTHIGGTFGAQAAQLAYLIQTTATAANPTFSWTASSQCNAVSAAFKPGSVAVAPFPPATVIRQAVNRSAFY